MLACSSRASNMAAFRQSDRVRPGRGRGGKERRGDGVPARRATMGRSEEREAGVPGLATRARRRRESETGNGGGRRGVRWAQTSWRASSRDDGRGGRRGGRPVEGGGWRRSERAGEREGRQLHFTRGRGPPTRRVAGSVPLSESASQTCYRSGYFTRCAHRASSGGTCLFHPRCVILLRFPSREEPFSAKWQKKKKGRGGGRRSTGQRNARLP